MAQRIKLRLTTAKVGVSMALAALVGGVVEKLSSGRGELQITRASSPGNFIKLGGLPQKIRTDFQKVEQKVVTLEKKWFKLNQESSALSSELASTEQKLVKDYLTGQQIDATFLKTSAAEAKFLKITTAAAEYLKITAAKNEFIQGRGGVVSAATRALADGSVTQLLKSPDGSLVVSLKTNADIISVLIDNTTGALIPAVQTTDNVAPQPLNLTPGNNVIPLRSPLIAHRLQLQTFGDGSSQAATTLVLSSEPAASNSKEPQVVAQMLIGLL
jgi:hypothetical protein